MTTSTVSCETARRTVEEHLIAGPDPAGLAAAVAHGMSCPSCRRILSGMAQAAGSVPYQGDDIAAGPLPDVLRRYAARKWAKPPRARLLALLSSPVRIRVPLCAAAAACAAMVLGGGLMISLNRVPGRSMTSKAMPDKSYNLSASAVWELCDTTEHDRVFGGAL